MYKKHIVGGFTLVELMIVLVIIGVLSAFALPIYQNYVGKAQLARVVYELSSTKASIETILANGGFPTVDAAQNGTPYSDNGGIYEYIGIQGDNPVSNIISLATIKSDDGSFGGIEAVVGGDVSAILTGTTIELLRNPSGLWSCEITMLNKVDKSDFSISGCKIVD